MYVYIYLEGVYMPGTPANRGKNSFQNAQAGDRGPVPSPFVSALKI